MTARTGSMYACWPVQTSCTKCCLACRVHLNGPSTTNALSRKQGMCLDPTCVTKAGQQQCASRQSMQRSTVCMRSMCRGVKDEGTAGKAARPAHKYLCDPCAHLSLPISCYCAACLRTLGPSPAQRQSSVHREAPDLPALAPAATGSIWNRRPYQWPDLVAAASSHRATHHPPPAIDRSIDRLAGYHPTGALLSWYFLKY